MTPDLLLLADGRLPAGGYAHSGGLEAAVAAGTVRNLQQLRAFLQGRLHTSGRFAAGVAGRAFASCAGAVGSHASDVDAPANLNAEVDAGIPSAAQRASSRSQGRALLRVGARMWPEVDLSGLSGSPHHPVVLGVLTRAAGGDRRDACRLASLAAVTGPASAAVRLLSLDPVEVQVLLAALSPEVEHVAQQAAVRPARPGSVLLDLLAEQHVRADVRLFAS